jgi:hypothetical protein
MSAKNAAHQENGFCRVSQSFLMMGMVVAGLLLFASSRADAQAGWTPWYDTAQAANSSPTGAQPSAKQGQVDEVLYTNFSGQLEFFQYGGAPQVIAGGSHSNPQCWVAGIITCLASTSTLTGVQFRPPTQISTHRGPGPPITLPKPTHPCTTLDCEVQALPWNEPVNLFWDGVNYVHPAWQSLGPLPTGWYTIVADSINVLHALAIGAGYALQERSMPPGGNWTAWQNLGGKYRGAPGCYQYNVTLQCYAPTYAGQMARIVYDGRNWQAATTLSQSLPATPSFVSVQVGRQEMFYVSGGHLMHSTGSGNTWNAAQDLSGEIFGPSAQCVALRFGFAMRCYALFTNGHILQREWIGNVGQIASFSVSPTVITQGQSPAMLEWSVANCPVPGCIFNISSAPVGSPNSPTGLSTPSTPSGSMKVDPSVSTKYWLSANDGYEAQIATTVLTVVAPQAPPPPPSSTPQTIGVAAVRLWNCVENGDAVSVWAGPVNSLTKVGSIANQWDDTGCATIGSQPGFVLTFAPAILAEYVITDPSLSGCTEDLPTNGPCIVTNPWEGLGQANGAVINVTIP